MRSRISSLFSGFLLLPIALCFTTGALAASISYSYDALSRVTSMTYGTCRVEYSYDSAGNMTRALTPTTTVFYRDSDGDDHGDPLFSQEACTQPDGYVSNQTDCNDADSTVNPDSSEICNGVDDNCDGQIDEGVTLDTYYQDLDDDGYGDSEQSIQTCTPAAHYVLIGGDCNDNSAAINPGMTEVCNSVDDNCNGQVDEGVTENYYLDLDQDGYGDPENSAAACSAPVNYLQDNNDCDDNRADVNPGMPELCNEIDDNCNGQVDEGLVFDTWFLDSDQDGYGDPGVSLLSCSPPIGYVGDDSDCNDSSAFIFPGAPERCNGLDDDCDTLVDEDATLYRDLDGDSYGNPEQPSETCDVADGYVVDGSDCNDSNASIHPGAEEICNQEDDNCNGEIDDQCRSSRLIFPVRGRNGAIIMLSL